MLAHRVLCDAGPVVQPHHGEGTGRGHTQHGDHRAHPGDGEQVGEICVHDIFSYQSVVLGKGGGGGLI